MTRKPAARATLSRRFVPDWVSTPNQHRLWRRDYLVALLHHLGFSSRFIADGFGISQTTVCRIVRSKKAVHLFDGKCRENQDETA